MADELSPAGSASPAGEPAEADFEAFPEPVDSPTADQIDYNQLIRADRAGRRESLLQNTSAEPTEEDGAGVSDQQTGPQRNYGDFAGGGRDALPEEEEVENKDSEDAEDNEDMESEQPEQEEGETNDQERRNAALKAARQYATFNTAGAAATAGNQAEREIKQQLNDPLAAVLKWFVVTLVVLGCGGGCFIIVVAAIIAPFYFLIRQATG